MLRLIDINQTINNEDMEIINQAAVLNQAIATHIVDSDNLFDDLNYLVSKSISPEDFERLAKEKIGITLEEYDYVINNLSVFISEQVYQQVLKEYNIHFLTQSC